MFYIILNSFIIIILKIYNIKIEIRNNKQLNEQFKKKNNKEFLKIS